MLILDQKTKNTKIVFFTCNIVTCTFSKHIRICNMLFRGIRKMSNDFLKCAGPFKAQGRDPGNAPKPPLPCVMSMFSNESQFGLKQLYVCPVCAYVYLNVKKIWYHLFIPAKFFHKTVIL